MTQDESTIGSDQSCEPIKRRIMYPNRWRHAQRYPSLLMADNAGDDNAIVYTDGSMHHVEKSSWGFLASGHGIVIADWKSAYMTSASIRMEV
uniref:Uncharacterized protein n=1 Tax=Arion vulgaris TaxID=1028688 RepID=A0A0B7AUI6_9EUPU